MIGQLLGVDSLEAGVAEVPDLATAAFLGSRRDEASLAGPGCLYSIAGLIKPRFAGLAHPFVRLQLRKNLAVYSLKAALRPFERTLPFFRALAAAEGEAGLADKDIVFSCGAGLAAEQLIEGVAPDEAGTF